MILEHVILQVIPGQEDAFESAFRQARPIIAGMRGFRTLRLERCVEDAARYLLLVEWDTLEDHTVGFRQSPKYEEWRRILHHFYDPFPIVEHYRAVAVE